MAAITGTHSDLREFFAQSEIPTFDQEQWNSFRDRYSSTGVDLGKPLDKLPADFVEGRSGSGWKQTVLKMGRILLMILIFPWGLYVGVRYLVQRLVMAFVFPAQSRPVRAFIKAFGVKELNKARQVIQRSLNRTQIQVYKTPNGLKVERDLENPYLVRQVVLGKNGARYRALMIATAESLATRRWVLQAPGNATPIEYCAAEYAQWYTHMLKANLLIIQGPGSGDNNGEVPSTDLGEPFDLALSCIEKDFKAKQIVLCGFSLGTASIGQAVKKHAFKTSDHSYVVVRQMGFDSIANVARRLNIDCCCCPCLSRFAQGLAKWTGCSFDNVEASRVLQDKQIDEIIVQAGAEPSAGGFHDDGVIPAEATLGRALKVQGIAHKKIFKCLPHAQHSTKAVAMPTVESLRELGFLPSPIQTELLTDPVDIQIALLDEEAAISENLIRGILTVELAIEKMEELLTKYAELLRNCKKFRFLEEDPDKAKATLESLEKAFKRLKDFISNRDAIVAI